jgi:uncharacterized protein YegP (UPF0339 family)
MVEIYNKNKGTYAFSLKSSAGRTLLTSVNFSTAEDIKETLASFKQSGNYHFERRTNHKGLFLFELKNNQGQVIGQSNLYRSEAGMENGIKNLKQSLISSNIDKV